MFGMKKEIRQLQETLQKYMQGAGADAQDTRKGQESVLTGLRQAQDSMTAVLRELQEGFSQMQESVRRHDMTIEDMLDEWEDMQQKHRQETESLKNELIERQKAELADLSGREKDLIDMTILAWDQLYMLCMAAQQAKDASWTQQLSMSEQMLRGKALQLGLERTGTAGEPFSYDVHEAVLRVDTDDPEKDMTVATVIAPGYWYRGTAYRKARVEVYRLKEEVHEA